MDKRTALVAATTFSVTLLAGGMHAGAEQPGESQCVVCSEPDQVYRCVVETPGVSVPVRALQYFCVRRIAREFGHGRCTARRADDAGAGCADAALVIERRFSYSGPLPRILRKLAEGEARPPAGAGARETVDGEPRTLVEFTNRAVEASGETVKKAGDTVIGVTRKAGRTATDVAKSAGAEVGKAAQKTGKVVGKAARTVGETLKDAAKSAYDCVRSFFKDCN